MKNKFAYILYILVGFLAGFVFGFVWEKSTAKISYLAIQGGCHFHHSLFGIVSFIFVPLFWGKTNKILFVISFGLGVITQHTLKDEFVFINCY